MRPSTLLQKLQSHLQPNSDAIGIKVMIAFMAFLTLFLLMKASQFLMLSAAFKLPILASMGASTCLILASPNSPFSKPWPVFGGHLASAFIGVACARFIANPAIAAALAVGCAVLAMQVLRCIHPPSAATALIAVLGGAPIHALSWAFCYQVTLINVATVIIVILVLDKLRFSLAQ